MTDRISSQKFRDRTPKEIFRKQRCVIGTAMICAGAAFTANAEPVFSLEEVHGALAKGVCDLQSDDIERIEVLNATPVGDGQLAFVMRADAGNKTCSIDAELVVHQVTLHDQEQLREREETEKRRREGEEQLGDVGESLRNHYVGLIRQRVQENWYIPPDVDPDDAVRLRLELLPNGELSNVSLEQGSGRQALDNSAVSALRRVDRFPVPTDWEMFQQYFSPSIVMEFSPQQ